MKDLFRFFDFARARRERRGTVNQDGLHFHGTFYVECYDKHGNLKWRDTAKNLIVNEGLDYALDVALSGAATTSPWYLGLFESNPTIAGGDTMLALGGTESTAYDEATRPQWGEGGASSQSITNATAEDFTMNASKTIYGLFLTSDNTKGDTAGTLWAEATFSGGSQAVTSGDVLKVTYTVNAAGS